MMERNDVNKLFTMLNAFYPHATNADNERTRKAWTLALEDYTYTEIKTAALNCARKEKFFPQLSELLAYLPTQKKDNSWMKQYIVKSNSAGRVSRSAGENGGSSVAEKAALRKTPAQQEQN